MDGNTALGASSPANPALHMPEPLSTTKAATSSSHMLMCLCEGNLSSQTVFTGWYGWVPRRATSEEQWRWSGVLFFPSRKVSRNFWRIPVRDFPNMESAPLRIWFEARGGEVVVAERERERERGGEWEEL